MYVACSYVAVVLLIQLLLDLINGVEPSNEGVSSARQWLSARERKTGDTDPPAVDWRDVLNTTNTIAELILKYLEVGYQ